jgi:putative FmdB family regulatory protein
MPLYEYRCESCGGRVEELQRMGADPPGPCPDCGGTLKRIYGRVGVVFGGWGFSRTDALLPDGRPRKDFKKLREKAQEIAES